MTTQIIQRHRDNSCVLNCEESPKAGWGLGAGWRAAKIVAELDVLKCQSPKTHKFNANHGTLGHSLGWSCSSYPATRPGSIRWRWRCCFSPNANVRRRSKRRLFAPTDFSQANKTHFQLASLRLIFGILSSPPTLSLHLAIWIMTHGWHGLLGHSLFRCSASQNRRHPFQFHRFEACYIAFMDIVQNGGDAVREVMNDAWLKMARGSRGTAPTLLKGRRLWAVTIESLSNDSNILAFHKSQKENQMTSFQHIFLQPQEGPI